MRACADSARRAGFAISLRVSFALVAIVLRAAGGLGAAETTPRMLLLDGAVTGNAILVVGERGAIFRSTDNANTWQRCPSPTRATLTAVTFAPGDANFGWAVGHDGQIIVTANGGLSWHQQFEGDVQDSFLDVFALDPQRVLAIGAYGLVVRTRDGGKTWSRARISEDDFHFNRVSAGPSGTLYIAGEHGTALRSRDAGETWTAIKPPYEGSLYGILPLDDRTLLTYGLRGHVFRSTDDGDSWERSADVRPVLLATGVRLGSGEILLAGHAETLLVSRDAGKTFVPSPAAAATALAELITLRDGRVLGLGEAGVVALPHP